MKTREMTKAALLFGVVGGICGFLYFLMFYFLDIWMFDNFQSLDFFIPLIFISLAIYYFRNGPAQGRMPFGQGLAVGLLTNAFISAIVGLFLWGFLAVIDTDYLPKSIEWQSERMNKKIERLTEESKAAKNDAVQKEKNDEVLVVKGHLEALQQTTPWMIAQDKQMKYFIVGTLFSVFLAFVFRRRKVDEVQ